ncbi:MAG: metal ABC transporter substrate-binding protein [Actinobacteria bacterium]|nr:metal ABC transporter substrate-binding protein [Actinomycetota bacterium]
MLRTILIIGATSLLLLTACGNDEVEADSGPSVVVTTTIIGDVVRNVVGADATIEVLVPTGADPHDYQASSRQVAGINRADLVVVNGLGLEEALVDVLQAAKKDGANILEIAPLLDPNPLGNSLDPHVWLDPKRMADAARLIAEEMTRVDASIDWSSRAEAYAIELDIIHREIESILEAVHGDSRNLVTDHDALGYFAAVYGFEVVGTVIPGGSTLGAPSSDELAKLVRLIEMEGVVAIFAGTTESSAVASAVAAEVGHEVIVVELYTGSLGEPGSGADTLVRMMLTNAELIAEALG